MSEKLSLKINKWVAKTFFSAGLDQELQKKQGKESLANEAVIPLLRRAGAEGIVLLKNEKSTLPIALDSTVSVFGRCAVNYFCVGYGSGGDIVYPYTVNLIEGLKNSGVKLNGELCKAYENWLSKPENEPFEGYWGHWPMSLPEMPLSEESVAAAAEKSDVALAVIGRAAGEDRENTLKKGSYYLTDCEIDMLNKVTAHFDRVCVILDCGNIIDMSKIAEYGDKISAIVYAWQGGMESGNSLADVLTGKVNPCGKLTDTIAVSYEKYPSADCFGGKKYNNYREDIFVGYRYFETFAENDVLYPFGFGLSYTSFDIKADAQIDGTKVKITAEVKNTGELAGSQVVQAYLSLPQGSLGNPAKILCGFAKTDEIEPSSSQTVTVEFDIADFAPYDDSGATDFKYSFVLEQGEYKIYAGDSIRSAAEIAHTVLTETRQVKQCSQRLAVRPKCGFKRMVNKNGSLTFKSVPTAENDIKGDIVRNLPKAVTEKIEHTIDWSEVKSGKYTPLQLASQLSCEELDDICHGEGKMDSALGVKGNAGAFGGVSEALRKRGIPPVITCDGPAGIRVKSTCALLPCGTALASTFNTELVERLYAEISREMAVRGADVLLAPGMNIHRNPLCGRNFEYYSEDPYLTGKIAAAAVKGIQKNGLSACPKHFACNNQEKNRNFNDSRVSERALREIYLKGFELMIRESRPKAMMTSYNMINGTYSYYNYELATAVLRNEWGYDGVLITDWWMNKGKSPYFENLTNDAYRVRAQVDVLMPGGDGFRPQAKVGRTLLKSHKQGGVTLGEMQRTAANVLSFIAKLEK